MKDMSYTQNRELSWLEFDKRVLKEGVDSLVPAYEKLKFVSIFTSNLDEFFMVRVGSLSNIASVNEKVSDNKTGWNARKQLEEIYSRIPDLYKLKDKIYDEVEADLRKSGIKNLKYHELDKNDLKFVNEYFVRNLYPILSALVIDVRHPFPLLQNKQLAIVANISDSSDNQYIGIVIIPSFAEDLVFLPGTNSYIFISDIVLNNLNLLFEGFIVKKSAIISVTRNADITLDEGIEDEDSNIRTYMKKALKRRRRLQAVRLEVRGNLSKSTVKYLQERLELSNNQIFYLKSPINMAYVFSFADRINPNVIKSISEPVFKPQDSIAFDKNRSIMDQVFEKDKLLHYPFESMDPFLLMLKEASNDPTVISIKITIYRLASISKVAEYLANAAENGKEVLCLMELRARFDEENNIDWSERLEEAGCTIIYGFEDYKVHSKICLITRYINGQFSHITQIGTGNYNEKTAKLYTDFSLITGHEGIGQDAVSFFKNMLVSKLDGQYNHLLAAPYGIKPRFLDLLDREIEKAKRGEPAEVKLKCNSITERKIIDKLSEASRAGVKVTLIIRGICCIKPGIKGKTDNIRVISIVGRFLEHHRLYIFGANNENVYIGSADLMTRNLLKRIELCVPIYDKDVKASLVNYMKVLLMDSKKSKELQADGSYKPVDGDGKISIQEYCMEKAIERAQQKHKSEKTGDNPHEDRNFMGNKADNPPVASASSFDEAEKDFKVSDDIASPKKHEEEKDKDLSEEDGDKGEGFLKRLFNKIFG